jgi:hypothetical protein
MYLNKQVVQFIVLCFLTVNFSATQKPSYLCPIYLLLFCFGVGFCKVFNTERVPRTDNVWEQPLYRKRNVETDNVYNSHCLIQ